MIWQNRAQEVSHRRNIYLLLIRYCPLLFSIVLWWDDRQRLRQVFCIRELALFLFLDLELQGLET